MTSDTMACKNDSDVYRAVPVKPYTSGSESSLVYSPEHRRVLRCDPQTIRLLLGCHGCRTLSGHAETIMRAGISADVVEVRRGLNALVHAGLLQSSASLLTFQSSDAARSTPPDITTIGVITANRPSSLRRCLESFGRHCTAHGRRPRFVVLDGSRNRGNRALNRQIAASELTAKGHDVEVLSTEDAESIRATVCRSCGLGANQQFGLTPGSAGANRNLLLLMTAGEHLLTVDDDVLCEPWALNRSNDIVLSGHTDTREAAFFTSRDAAVGAAPPIAVDLISEHTRLLGRSFASLIRDSDRPPDLRYACAHLTSRMAAGLSLEVRVTMSGLAGDSGFARPERQLFGSGVPRARLAATAESYRTGLTYREVYRIADRYLLTHDPHCMAFCMGLANLVLLPPFSPVGRNEDGVFAALLLASDPGTLFGHLPCGIIHASDRSALYDGPENQSAALTRLSELLIDLIQSTVLPEPTCGPIERLKGIARFLRALADGSTDAFESYATQVLLDARYRELSLIDALTSARSDYPGYWKSGLASYRETLLANITRREFFVPVECRQRTSVEDGVRRTQELVRSFARVLEHWPALWGQFRHTKTARHPTSRSGGDD